MKVRINTDVSFSWKLLVQGKEVDWKEYDLTLEMTKPSRNKEEVPFTSNGSVVSFSYKPNQSGQYIISAYLNRYKDNEAALDSKIFESVKYSWNTDYDEDNDDSLNGETVEIDGNLVYVVGFDLEDYYTKEDLDDVFDDLELKIVQKQDRLKSGINIKTINTKPVIGYGDLSFPFDKGTGANSAVLYSSGNSANADYSLAVGFTNTANGDYSIAAGRSTETLANGAVSLGYGASAGTVYSIAGGKNSKTINKASSSIAFGENTIAEGYQTVAMNKGTHAVGNYSAALGEGNETLNRGEFAAGKYNISSSDTLFSIGNGSSKSDRNNAIELKTNGDIYFSCLGDVTLKKYIDDKFEELKQMIQDGMFDGDYTESY